GADGAARATAELLAAQTSPTAIVFDSDEMALSGARVVLASGADIPGDVAIASYEDSPLARTHRPSLTALGRSAVEYGRVAARRAIARCAPEQSLLESSRSIPHSSTAEHSTVNRAVLGSNPSAGAAAAPRPRRDPGPCLFQDGSRRRTPMAVAPDDSFPRPASFGPGSVWADRSGHRSLVGRNQRGVEIPIGHGEGEINPGELLKLALIGCAGMSSDITLTRRLGEDFEMRLWAHGTSDEEDNRYHRIAEEVQLPLDGLTAEE